MYKALLDHPVAAYFAGVFTFGTGLTGLLTDLQLWLSIIALLLGMGVSIITGMNQWKQWRKDNAKTS